MATLFYLITMSLTKRADTKSYPRLELYDIIMNDTIMITTLVAIPLQNDTQFLIITYLIGLRLCQWLTFSKSSPYERRKSFVASGTNGES